MILGSLRFDSSSGRTLRQFMRPLAAALVMLALQGCSSLPNLLGDDPTPSSSSGTTAEPSGIGTAKAQSVAPDMSAAEKTEPVADLYNKGLEQLKKQQYKTAAKQFEEVERQHPYSELATKSILMAAF
jgi:outer membrane protein assembly factor BamD